MSSNNDSQRERFRVSSRMPLLLGDELIPSPGYAIFELVKNAHDAGACRVQIHLQDVSNKEYGTITVTDDGTGMTLDTIRNEWLVLGSDGKRRKRRLGERTARGNRVFLGEKGIGRFAVHKLGEVIEVVTRASDPSELVISVNWKDFDPKDAPEFLENIPVTIRSRRPAFFTGRNGQPVTGTKITISCLREPLTRGIVRNLHRDVVSISSPFKTQSDFRAELTINPEEDWLSNLIKAEDVYDQAPFMATCQINENAITVKYEFLVQPELSEK